MEVDGDHGSIMPARPPNGKFIAKPPQSVNSVYNYLMAGGGQNIHLSSQSVRIVTSDVSRRFFQNWAQRVKDAKTLIDVISGRSLFSRRQALPISRRNRVESSSARPFVDREWDTRGKHDRLRLNNSLTFACQRCSVSSSNNTWANCRSLSRLASAKTVATTSSLSCDEGGEKEEEGLFPW